MGYLKEAKKLDKKKEKANILQELNKWKEKRTIFLMYLKMKYNMMLKKDHQEIAD